MLRKSVDTGICILAGGLSQRMGREKARLRLGRRTLLGHVRHTASALGLDVRVIRKDLVPRCGPLGGIYTGLKTSTHDAEMFLSCDMPFVTVELLKKVMRSFDSQGRSRSSRFGGRGLSVFVEHRGVVGFPLQISTANLELVEKEIQAGRFSLQNLAKRLNAKRVRLKDAEARQLLNVNTPADWAQAQRRRAELPL